MTPLIIRYDRYPIIRLIGIGIRRIINQYNIAERSIHNSQVLDKHSILGLMTVLSEQPVLDILSFRVESIKYDIGIAGVAGCEYNDLEVG